MPTISPFSHPFYVMAKPAGPRCNLACRYCYYTEKTKYYAGETPKGNPEGIAEQSSATDRKNGRAARFSMPDELLERFVRQYIEAQTTPAVLFTWHGGEPLLRPISFYEKAIALQRRYAGGRVIDNCIQTNGTLITEEWCRFIRDNNFLVGISIDGPRRFHDAMRQNSFDKVMHAIDLCNQYDVQWNAMATVNSLNAGYPLEFYRFFRDIGCRYLQFTPVVERLAAAEHSVDSSSEPLKTLENSHSNDEEMLMPGLREGGAVTDFSVTPRQWGEFLCAVFDEWAANDVGEIFIQLFEAVAANYAGVAPGICSLSPTCGHSLALEHNGDLYSCDHFVFPEYFLGNINDEPMVSLAYSERQQNFARAKSTALPQQCRECRFLFTCNGECPRNRFVCDAHGQPFLNYLCEGYKMFFAHSEPWMCDFLHEYENI